MTTFEGMAPAKTVQTTLDFEARARATDPQTSHMAAQNKNDDGGTKTLAAQIAATLLSCRVKHPNENPTDPNRRDGMTTRELSIVLGVDLVSVSPALRPLTRKGITIESGVVRRNPGTKQKAIVWLATGKVYES